MKMFASLIVGLVLGATSMALAEGRHAACKEDIAKFCSGIEKGGGKIAKCLKEHSADLSEGCKEHAEKAKEKMKEVKEACHDDVKKLCPDVKAGGGRIKKCMIEHKEQLSEGCKAEFKALKK